MKNSLLLSMILFFFLGCNQIGKDKASAVDSLALQDSLKAAQAIEFAALSGDLSKDKEQYIALYNKIVSSKDFKVAYSFAKGLEHELDSIFGNIQSDSFEVIERRAKEILGTNLPAMEITLVAEGTMAAVMYNHKTLLEKAKKTPEPDDDDFISLLIDAFGEQGLPNRAFGTWFNQTWDYGGGSLLGQGIHLKLLKQIDKIKNTGTVFAPDCEPLKEILFNDMLQWKIYEEPAEAIIKELNEITGFQSLTSQDKDKLKARIEQFKDPKKNGLQVNCKAGNCDYGG